MPVFLSIVLLLLTGCVSDPAQQPADPPALAEPHESRHVPCLAQARR